MQELPIRLSRQRVPVGTINPSKKRMAGYIKGQRDEGPGMHWWYQLTDDDFLASKLPTPSDRTTGYPAGNSKDLPTDPPS